MESDTISNGLRNCAIGSKIRLLRFPDSPDANQVAYRSHPAKNQAISRASGRIPLDIMAQ